MKKLCILLSSVVPLTCFAQAPRAAIVVEDESIPLGVISPETETTPSNLDLTTEAPAPAASVPEETLQELLQQPVEKVAETLPEQPDEFKSAKPSEAVTVKTEAPKQINLAAGESSGFKLLSPWAPKPLQKAPVGWRYVPVNSKKSYPLKVTLSSGVPLSLSITPYALVPESSNLVVQACEPGYQPELGYQQINSVTARLEKTTQTLESAAASLDESIKNLSALVDSLPK